MDLSNLKPAKNSVRNKIRLGKGQGSGKGGTATKGHKGAKSRSGFRRKKGYEGGQMPLQRRVPKYGFTNISRKEYKSINIGTLQNLAEKKNLKIIDVQALIDAGFVSKNDRVKILGDGKLTSKLEVKAHAFSKSAIKAIESLEGSAEKI
jgi:large subunit ribosomal protein L15